MPLQLSFHMLGSRFDISYKFSNNLELEGNFRAQKHTGSWTELGLEPQAVLSLIAAFPHCIKHPQVEKCQHVS